MGKEATARHVLVFELFRSRFTKRKRVSTYSEIETLIAKTYAFRVPAPAERYVYRMRGVLSLPLQRSGM